MQGVPPFAHLIDPLFHYSCLLPSFIIISFREVLFVKKSALKLICFPFDLNYLNCPWVFRFLLPIILPQLLLTSHEVLVFVSSPCFLSFVASFVCNEVCALLYSILIFIGYLFIHSSLKIFFTSPIICFFSSSVAISTTSTAIELESFAIHGVLETNYSFFYLCQSGFCVNISEILIVLLLTI